MSTQPLFSQVLKDFATHFGIGQNKRIVLPLAQAKWHMSKQLACIIHEELRELGEL